MNGERTPVRRVPPSQDQVRVGEVWNDGESNARVLAVAEGYAMLRRHRRNPFIASVSIMVDGLHYWRRVSP